MVTVPSSVDVFLFLHLGALGTSVFVPRSWFTQAELAILYLTFKLLRKVGCGLEYSIMFPESC